MKAPLTFLIFTLIIAFLVLTLGYAKQGGEDLEYELIEEYSEDIEQALGFVKDLRGFGIISSKGDEYIIYIGSGVKSTGGYGITVDSVKRIGDLTQIKISETSPGADEFLTQALTYPKIVIKVGELGDKVQVVNSEGELFEDINEETKEAEYIDNKNL